MLDDIKDSIKAKLYDFAYTPFMSSYIISWVLLNHKYLLVYFGDSTLEKKLMHLSVYHIEFLYPLYIALIYVFIYPAFALGFYYATLFYNKWSKWVKQKIENETPIPQEEARKIRADITRLSDEKDDTLIKLGKKEEEYKEKLKNAIQPLESKTASLSDRSTKAEQELQQLLKETESLNSQLSQANKMLDIKIEQCDELQQKVEELTSQLSAVGVVNATVQVGSVQVDSSVATNNEPDTDFMKVVRYFYDSYNITDEESLLNKLNSEKGVAKLVARDIINKLISDNVLSKDNINRILITPEGTSQLIKTIDGRNNE